jgi:hypothetical protein
MPDYRRNTMLIGRVAALRDAVRKVRTARAVHSNPILFSRRLR